MNAIFCGISVVLFYFCYRPPKFEDMNASNSKLQQLKELDYVGLALYSGGAVSLLLGFGEYSRITNIIFLLLGMEINESTNIK
jgi:hypothetical protein